MIIITTSRRGEAPVTHRFDGERIRIGREEDNDLVLPSPACSRHHAEIVFEDGLWKVVDRGSTNKIVVSDQRVAE